MEKLRISLLAGIFGSVFFVLVRIIIFTPTSGNKIATPFVFPTDVPLPEWRLLESDPLPVSIAETTGMSKILSGRHYRYIQKNQTLDIEMQYSDNNLGDVKLFIENHTSIPLTSSQIKLALRYQEGIGFYNLFSYQQRTYLSTCINSQGGSTVTVSQFTRNRLLYDMRLGHLLLWLLGRRTLSDKRCLWAQLSIPLKNSSPDDAEKTLEKTWVFWYQWWKPRFPKL